MKEYFTSNAVVNNLSTLNSLLEAQATGSDLKSRAAQHLQSVIPFFVNPSNSFDLHCQYSIKRYGQLLPEARHSAGNFGSLRVDLYVALFYLFICEYDISAPGELSLELSQFRQFAEDETLQFDSQSQAIIQYADRRLPVAILKDLVGGVEVQSLKEVPQAAEAVIIRIKSWKADLDTKEETVKRLQETLELQRNAFNFVGLFNGFDILSTAKKKELKNARAMMWIIGLLILVPVGVDITALALHSSEVTALNGVLIAAFAAATFSATFILGYFYRIFLKSSETCKAQLLHIEFRKTLCQFVQDYVKYADELKNKDVLKRFEAVIFAPIPYGDDKGISMFDGLEQIAGLVNSVRGKDEKG